MTPATSARRLQRADNAQRAPFPSKQLFILGMSPSPLTCGEQFETIHYRTSALTNAGARCFTIFSKHALANINPPPISVMSHLRADRLHVHLPLRLLYDPVLQNHLRHPPNSSLRRNGHLRICLRRVLIRGCLGSDQRQGGKEAGPSCWISRHSAQYVGVWIRSKSASCAGRASPGRITQWVGVHKTCFFWLDS